MQQKAEEETVRKIAINLKNQKTLSFVVLVSLGDPVPAMSRKGRTRSFGDGDDKNEQPLQAILLADSFTKSNTFRPITLEQPKVLMPLVNVPCLQYTIEFLASSGVGEIFIFCSSHADKVEAFVQATHWPSTLKIECIKNNSCQSAGDALRELDNLGQIRSDPFVLVNGDVVSNINLAPVIAAHQARKKKDHHCIMTTLFKQASTSHPTRPLFDDLVVATDRTTGQILRYENDCASSSVSLPTALFFEEGHCNVQIRYDLLDTHIDICSPEVLLKFTDNFDYQDTRHFIHMEVQDLELGDKIAAHVIQSEYAARVHDPRTYDAVSKDVLHRWVTPMVPDNNFLSDTTYKYQRGCIYKEAEVSLARQCSVGMDTAIGSGSSVGARSVITHSVIGRRVAIGEDATVSASYLWNDVTVADGASVEKSILCDGVVVKAGATVGRGCVLSYGVVVGAGQVVPPFTRLTKAEEDDGFDDDDEDEEDVRPWDHAVVGEDGAGWVWRDEDGGDDDDDDDDDDEDDAGGGAAAGIPALMQHSIGADEAVAARAAAWRVWDAPSSSDEDDEDFDIDTTERFPRAIYELMLTAEDENQALDNIFMEIKGMKFAQNKSFAECLEALLPPILDMALEGKAALKPAIASVQGLLKKWSSVLSRCLIDQETQVAFLGALQHYCLDPENVPARVRSSAPAEALCTPLYRFALQMMAEKELGGLGLTTEDSLIDFFGQCRRLADGSPERRLFDLPATQEFVAWVEEDDSDDDDDDDDDDSDEEESDE